MRLLLSISMLFVVSLPFTVTAGDVKPIVPRTDEQNAECRQAPVYVWIEVTNVLQERGFITAQLHDGDPDKWLEGKEKIDRERWAASAE